jgi:hypothetical protein
MENISRYMPHTSSVECPDCKRRVNILDNLVDVRYEVRFDPPVEVVVWEFPCPHCAPCEEAQAGSKVCKHLDTTYNLVPMPFGPGLCNEPIEECVHLGVTEQEIELCALGKLCQHYARDTYVEQDYLMEIDDELL